MSVVAITPKSKEILKQRARKLKRTCGITHTEALDQVAKEIGCINWHHVCKGVDLFAPTEEAYSTGCIVAFDPKEGEDFDVDDGVFVEDHLAETFCKKDLFEDSINSINEDDPNRRTFKETMEDSELQELFGEDGCVFFRLTDLGLVFSVDDVLKLVQKYSFWSPWYIWYEGKFHSTHLGG